MCSITLQPTFWFDQGCRCSEHAQHTGSMLQTRVHARSQAYLLLNAHVWYSTAPLFQLVNNGPQHIDQALHTLLHRCICICMRHCLSYAGETSSETSQSAGSSTQSYMQKASCQTDRAHKKGTIHAHQYKRKHKLCRHCCCKDYGCAAWSLTCASKAIMTAPNWMAPLKNAPMALRAPSSPHVNSSNVHATSCRTQRPTHTETQCNGT